MSAPSRDCRKPWRQSGARHVVTLINKDTPVARPAAVEVDDHLFLGMHDILRSGRRDDLPG
jgi:predicted protein tyrosine phosphatase